MKLRRAKIASAAKSALEETAFLSRELGRLSSVKVESVPFEGIVPLVTLDDPSADPSPARNAFARLRPPEGLSPGETASWRESVAGIARAVRVVPQPRRTGLARPEKDARRTPSEDVRQEATALAVASKDPEVVALVEVVLSEVE